MNKAHLALTGLATLSALLLPGTSAAALPPDYYLAVSESTGQCLTIADGVATLGACEMTAQWDISPVALTMPPMPGGPFETVPPRQQSEPHYLMHTERCLDSTTLALVECHPGPESTWLLHQLATGGYLLVSPVSGDVLALDRDQAVVLVEPRGTANEQWNFTKYATA
ncbi:hypothetical protein JOD54_002237 [Actinokineospora baliensis]|uniref:RICIN domain-containing protein n=1 Tax=Actinokineospora baliensis TaxID=547056 RepID=UPI00195ADD40|nr:hypothetical protein [Actinokineospora baliensis]MBM7772033.1 hypothetical protein [Actinokineospora baliensis]